MTLVVGWLVFPLSLVALTLGCGLVLEALAGTRLALPLLVPAGLAVVVVVMCFATLTDATAELAVPLVVALAVVGLGLGATGLRARFDPWAVGVGVAAYAVYAGPTVASGEATFAGYVKLDDTATYLGTLDYVLERGLHVAGLPPSTYEAMLALLLSAGLSRGQFPPARPHTPCRRRSRLDLAAVPRVPRRAPRTRPLRARGRGHTRALAAGARRGDGKLLGVLYGYALWGGVKELYAAVLVALLAATATLAWRRAPRAALVPAVVTSAFLLGLSVAAAIWLIPVVGVTLVAAWRRRTLGSVVLAGLATVALSLPALVAAPDFLDGANEVARGTDVNGNMLGPLSPWQLAGIWPSEDFRVAPEESRATIVLVGVALAAGTLGAVIAYRRRAWRLLVLLATAVIGACVFVVSSGPWIEGKALAIASPAVLALALVGGAALVEAGRRVEGALVLAALVGGVAWSNVLASGDARLAPRGQLAELEAIGVRYAGEGPALMTEYQPYGVRHFLRRLDPEGASELRRRPVLLRDGRMLGKGETAPIDAFFPDALLVYQTLVLLRSGPGGVPPSPFTLVERGRYYDVWQRPA